MLKIKFSNRFIKLSLVTLLISFWLSSCVYIFYLDYILHPSSFFRIDQTYKVVYQTEPHVVSFKFDSPLPYLGIIYLPIPELATPSAIIRVSTTVFHHKVFTSTYKYGEVSGNSLFPVGIPIVADSNGHTVTVSISSPEMNPDPYPNHKIEVISQHFFHKDYALSHPQILIQLLVSLLTKILQNSWLVLMLLSGPILLVSYLVGPEYLPTFMVSSCLVMGIIFRLSNYTEVSDTFVTFGLAALFSTVVSRMFMSLYIKVNRRHTLPLLFIASSIIITIISSFNPWYYLGGDETRVYYQNPQIYIKNYAHNIIQNTAPSNVSSYSPVRSLLPFVTVLSAAKNILKYANLQAIFFSLNIIFGLYFSYLLLKEFLPDSSSKPILCVLFPLLYVFSSFNAYTIYNAQNFSQYTLSLLPFSLWMLIKSLQSKSKILILILVLVWSILPIYPMLPVILASLLSTSPLLVFLLIKHKFTLVKNIFVFLFLFIIINTHWLGHLGYQFFNHSLVSNLNSSFSVGGKQELYDGIISITKLTNPIFPLLGLYHYQIQKDFNWSQLTIFESWYLKIIPLNLLLLVLFLTSLILSKKLKQHGLFLALSISFLVSVYLFTGKFGPVGPKAFAWVISSVPGMSMFRNMYDKFSLPLAFFYMLVMSMSSAIFLSRIKNNRHAKVFLFVLFIIIIANIKPVIDGEFSHLNIWTTQSSQAHIKSLNHNYLDAIAYIGRLPTSSRILNLPLNSGNLAIISDASLPQHYYVGVSPMLILSGKNDISGFLSFGNLQNTAQHLINIGDFKEFGQLLKSLGITHVLVHNSLPQDLLGSYLFQGNAIALQTPALYSELLGPKESDFGKDYSLYQIRPSYLGSTLYFSTKSDPVNNHKLSDGIYTLDLPPAASEDLVFSELFNSQWQLTIGNKVIGSRPDELFGNVWNIQSHTKDVKALIIFKPVLFSKYFVIISWLGVGIVLSLLVISMIKYKHAET